ncbi:flotillin family protein [Thiofilum flexile]|uniref:flotillin family protein n=1 Tax=Thiofilum flexile TaxID=125627 RepID=UPI000367F58A|nr:flotillin domain-containing protein [Thiofilum flexile]
MDSLTLFFIIVLMVLLLVVAAMAAFYKRTSKDLSFVRTGFGGEKVVLNGGAFVLPVIHEATPINMQTIAVKVERSNKAALITKDPLRVDVMAEFRLSVPPDPDAISKAARTLGTMTMSPEKVQKLVEEQCVAALRSVASNMELQELHLKRKDFERNVEQAVNQEFEKNGLELESVSLVRLDQTAREYFDPSNAFDAQGLTILDQITSENEKRRNFILREKEVEIQKKDLESEKKKLELDMQEFFAQKEREKEKAEQEAKITREIEEINFAKTTKIDMARRDMEVTQAQLDKSIAEAWIEADKVKAQAAAVTEEIGTAREKAEAERNRIIEIISAEKEAERQRIIAQANALSEELAAKAAEIRYGIEAAGKRALNEAANLLSNEQISMQLKLEIVKQLPNIVRESVRPLENIEGIKIMHLDGLNQVIGGGGAGGSGVGGANPNPSSSLSDQVVDSALRYRAQLPIVESLLSEVGLKGNSLNQLTEGIRQELSTNQDSGVKLPPKSQSTPEDPTTD